MIEQFQTSRLICLIPESRKRGQYRYQPSAFEIFIVTTSCLGLSPHWRYLEGTQDFPEHNKVPTGFAALDS